MLVGNMSVIPKARFKTVSKKFVVIHFLEAQFYPVAFFPIKTVLINNTHFIKFLNRSDWQIPQSDRYSKQIKFNSCKTHSLSR